jgi:hypothetical protein
MQSIARTLSVVCLLAPMASQAVNMVWSSCQTITAVSNYVPYNDSFYLTLSPGISGCTGNSGGAASAVGFVGGQLNVTDTNMAGLLAMSLAAVTAGSQVMIYYDSSSTPQCNAMLVAIHGFAAQCP